MIFTGWIVAFCAVFVVDGSWLVCDTKRDGEYGTIYRPHAGVCCLKTCIQY